MSKYEEALNKVLAGLVSFAEYEEYIREGNADSAVEDIQYLLNVIKESQSTINSLGATIIDLEDNIAELHKENERNEVRRSNETNELKSEINDLIMKIAILENK